MKTDASGYVLGRILELSEACPDASFGSQIVFKNRSIYWKGGLFNSKKSGQKSGHGIRFQYTERIL